MRLILDNYTCLPFGACFSRQRLTMAENPIKTTLGCRAMRNVVTNRRSLHEMRPGPSAQARAFLSTATLADRCLWFSLSVGLGHACGVAGPASLSEAGPWQPAGPEIPSPTPPVP